MPVLASIKTITPTPNSTSPTPTATLITIKHRRIHLKRYHKMDYGTSSIGYGAEYASTDTELPYASVTSAENAAISGLVGAIDSMIFTPPSVTTEFALTYTVTLAVPTGVTISAFTTTSSYDAPERAVSTISVLVVSTTATTSVFITASPSSTTAPSQKAAPWDTYSDAVRAGIIICSLLGLGMFAFCCWQAFQFCRRKYGNNARQGQADAMIRANRRQRSRRHDLETGNHSGIPYKSFNHRDELDNPAINGLPEDPLFQNKATMSGARLPSREDGSHRRKSRVLGSVLEEVEEGHGRDSNKVIPSTRITPLEDIESSRTNSSSTRYFDASSTQVSRNDSPAYETAALIPENEALIPQNEHDPDSQLHRAHSAKSSSTGESTLGRSPGCKPIRI
ncbi:hypothetical protein RUND412_006824 [Rhizina undulata]